MAFLRFFKLPKNQQFTYQPRYWDPEKEDLEERLKLAKEGNAEDVEAVKARLRRGGFRKGGYTGGANSRFRKQQTRRSNLTLIVIIVIFALPFLYDFDGLPSRIGKYVEPRRERE